MRNIYPARECKKSFVKLENWFSIFRKKTRPLKNFQLYWRIKNLCVPTLGTAARQFFNATANNIQKHDRRWIIDLLLLNIWYSLDSGIYNERLLNITIEMWRMYAFGSYYQSENISRCNKVSAAIKSCPCACFRTKRRRKNSSIIMKCGHIVGYRKEKRQEHNKVAKRCCCYFVFARFRASFARIVPEASRAVYRSIVGVKWIRSVTVVYTYIYK